MNYNVKKAQKAAILFNFKCFLQFNSSECSNILSVCLHDPHPHSKQKAENCGRFSQKGSNMAPKSCQEILRGHWCRQNFKLWVSKYWILVWGSLKCLKILWHKRWCNMCLYLGHLARIQPLIFSTWWFLPTVHESVTLVLVLTFKLLRSCFLLYEKIGRIQSILGQLYLNKIKFRDHSEHSLNSILGDRRYRNSDLSIVNS